ncbi:MAG: GNAT family N-acetyltransferase [Candidatus Marinimicrobia bacterium]|nr:GNAT family N-acetyltransferase [Candidatus Neomarinimicrobiota bacterium]MBT3617562.1 GNAT family N-acetyltransferase [Candidatus Neomarinimicrobiota bacterium]MBT3829239.1 GNAT family N-acetyltransferase [Candidatus Neomarinimicrobiota bacterium]MBT3996767.1 GNAT family N-acetyltransferase [Candidatus Neomarinimicrobiota bacterium]MBT4280363.1 GNAT family N-acetyltransferase [Candidatus Neomarinimicrobiota bacterium]
MKLTPESTPRFLEKVELGEISASELLEIAQSINEDVANHQSIHAFLDVAAHPYFQHCISENDCIDPWLKELVRLMELSGYHIGHVIEDRAKRYGDKTVFQIIQPDEIVKISFKQLLKYIRRTGQGIFALTKGKEPTIGILTPNTFKGTLVDLACLSFGFNVVPLPLNSTSEDLKYIIEHSGITHIFSGGQRAAGLLAAAVNPTSDIRTIQLRTKDLTTASQIGWDAFLANGADIQQSDLLDRRDQLDINGIATIMYTSGTTAHPKGIVFTPLNIISKRFARALALPGIGPDDIFLSFLPLYHTFGRYLEMLGSIFLGATYTFARSPQFQSLLSDFKIIRPTVFISVPKRWNQIYELCDGGSPDTITGGRLKWGLSAAGYLEPAVFKFFQKNNVSLMSGYGMTEATGGITMTPPADYKPDSVGKSLPGIELLIAEDGELLIRGAYVSPGYLGEQQKVIQRDSSWFHTGDIFKETNKHFTIVDRKKEIYKNSRGQTIAPQKIENLFKDFDSIHSVFLIGDGMEYNCILIYPDQTFTELKSTADTKEIQNHFSTIVNSVNSFLPPHERLVNFALIPRAFSSEHGELTKKGTVKRKAIIKNFSSVIEPMYKRSSVSFIKDEIELRIPNWIIREKGILSSNVEWNGKKLTIKGKPVLTLLSCEKGFQVGDFVYILPKPTFDLEMYLRSPELWLGNIEFVNFLRDIPFRLSEFNPSSEIDLYASHVPLLKNTRHEAVPFPDEDGKTEDFLKFLHNQAIVLRSNSSTKIISAVAKFESMTQQPGSIWNHIIPSILLRLNTHPKIKCRSAMLNLAVSLLKADVFAKIIRDSLEHAYNLEDLNAVSFDSGKLVNDHIKSFLNQLNEYKIQPDSCTGFSTELIKKVFIWMVDFAKDKPKYFLPLRTEFSSWNQPFFPVGIQKNADKAFQKLESNFRTNLIHDSTKPYREKIIDLPDWKDVISFDPSIDEALQIHIINAIENTPLLNEALVLAGREIITLNNIPIDGIWISAYHSESLGRAFRLLVRPKNDASFNLILNSYNSTEEQNVNNQVKILTLAGPTFNTDACSNLLFGHYPKFNLYTEAFSIHSSVEDLLNRHREDIESGLAIDRWQMRWFHYIWTSAQLSLELWKRTGCQKGLSDPDPSQFCIPEHDFSDGGYITSIFFLRETQSLLILIQRFANSFISRTEARYKELSMMSGWEVILTVVLEVFGIRQGLVMLRSARDEMKDDVDYGLSQETISSFISEVESDGILPKKLVFATIRYERWSQLNPNATVDAKSEIIFDLYQDYRLAHLLQIDPSIRLQFFLMTCFKDSHEQLRIQLEQMVLETRKGIISETELTDKLQIIHKTSLANNDDKFFLTRLIYEHVGSADFAELVAHEGESSGHLDLIYLIHDKDGLQYTVRPPSRPKDIAQFNSLLEKADFFISIKQEHEFMLLFTEDDDLVGGIIWRETRKNIAHLEKVVIASAFRNKGLSIPLINELVFRLHSRSYSHLTVNFIHSDLFYKIGFKIDNRFGGLVLPIKEKMSP